VRLTHTLWGGRFNPIVLVDRPEEAKQLIERLRADVIWPVGDAVAVKDFPKQFPYLINPFFRAMLHLPEKNRPSGTRGTEARVIPRLQGTSELGLSRFAHTGCRGEFFDAMFNLVQTPVI
jgi:hypothetical protein